MKLFQLVSLVLVLQFCVTAAAVLAADPAPPASASLTGNRTFATPAAVAAQKNYNDALAAARHAYDAGLDRALKIVMSRNNLDEANALNEARKKIAAGGIPAVAAPFKTPEANEPRIRYENAAAQAQRQYARDLDSALKAAMASGNLEDANAIREEGKALNAVVGANAATLTKSLPPLGAATAGRSSPGLVYLKYPKHRSQMNGDKRAGYVPYTDLGKPVGGQHTIKSFGYFTKAVDENAVISGFLRIDQPGKYEFRTKNDWDRNELLIDGNIVCKFQDGENKAQSVELRAGVLPIVCAVYAIEAKGVNVEWKPPGQKDWSDIPPNLLTH